MKNLLSKAIFTAIGIGVGAYLTISGIAYAAAFLVASGGTGSTTLNVNQILEGNGTSAIGSNTATGTSPFGINVTTGCFAVGGTCIGAGSVTSVTLATPNSTLSLGGTNPVTTAGTINADLNLAHSNWWTALQNFTNATTSGLEASSTNVYFDGFTSALLGVSAGHQLTAYAGSSNPCTNQVPTTLTALAILGGCTSINNSWWSGAQLTEGNGGTNATSLGANMILVNNGASTIVASSTPTAASYDATSTTLASIFPYASSTAITASSEINHPNSGTVPTLYAGDVYINTNSTASSSVAFGTAAGTAHSLFSTHSFSGILATSTLSYMGPFGAAGTTTLIVANPIHSSTLQSFFCKTDVGTANLRFGNGAASTTIVACTSGGASGTSLSNNTWGGRQSIYIDVGDSTGGVNQIVFTADVEDRN